MVDKARAMLPNVDSASAPPGTRGRLHELFQRTIGERGRSGGFLISLSLLITTFAARAVTHAIRDQRLTSVFRNVSSQKGLHIHHCVFGILGLLGVGYTDIRFQPKRVLIRRVLAVFYGVAAALTLDEFALWLRLRDVYWTPEGRESVDALIVAGACSLLALEGMSFWQALWRDTIWLIVHRGGLVARMFGPRAGELSGGVLPEDANP
jgi:hypothetical protein